MLKSHTLAVCYFVTCSINQCDTTGEKFGVLGEADSQQLPFSGKHTYFVLNETKSDLFVDLRLIRMDYSVSI